MTSEEKFKYVFVQNRKNCGQNYFVFKEKYYVSREDMTQEILYIRTRF